MSREYCLFVLEGGSGTTPYCTPVAPAATANIWTTAATTGLPSTASGARITPRSMLGWTAGIRSRCGLGRSCLRPLRRRFRDPRVHGQRQAVLDGMYKTKLYAGAFTQMLLQLACQQVNSLGWVGGSGVSAGWQYGPAAGSAGNQCGNLPSVSIFHAIQRSDGTFKHRLYCGVRVKSWNFTLCENSTIGDLTLQLTGAYAAGNPYTYLNYVDPTAKTYAVPATFPVFNTTTMASTWCAPTTHIYPVNPWLFLNTCSTGGTGATDR